MPRIPVGTVLRQDGTPLEVVEILRLWLKATSMQDVSLPTTAMHHLETGLNAVKTASAKGVDENTRQASVKKQFFNASNASGSQQAYLPRTALWCYGDATCIKLVTKVIVVQSLILSDTCRYPSGERDR